MDAVAELDGLQLANVLRAGIFRLYRQTDHINRINVFPVPDGDTGTNMSMTMAAVLAALDRTPLEHAGEVLIKVADAALDGARGNSGAILAQFFSGLADRAGALQALSIGDFASALASGAAYAREALTGPREGTLLTVLAEFAAVTTHLAKDGSVTDFRSLLAQALKSLRRALAATQNQLDALRAAGVVDAGALGLVELIEGASDYLETGIIDTVAMPSHEADAPMALADTNDEFRFCVECMITAEGIPQRKLKEAFGYLGGSLVTGGIKSKVRVHIHTNNPEQVFALAADFGIVSSQKADDMSRQQHATRHPKNQQVVIVTDSAADIPDSQLEQLDIHMVPVRVHFGDHSYLDKVSLSPAQFYHELAINPLQPKTSQPPPGDFRRLFEFLTSHYQAVVCINVSSKVSGTYDGALAAAARVDAARITIIDSGNASLGQGLIVMHAAQAAQRGASAQQVSGATRAAIRCTTTFALLSRLDYAVRGGRVPRAVKLCADFLRFAPILVSRPDGQISLGGLILGRFRLRQRFARWVGRRMRNDVRYRVLVGHGDCEVQGQALLQDIRNLKRDLESIELTSLGTALGVHGGPGLLVVAIQDRAPQRHD